MHEMMNRTINLFLLIFLLSGTTGCDKISSLFGRKSSAKNQKVVSASPVSSPASTSFNNPQENVIASLPANVLAKVGNWTLTLDEFKERLKNLKDVVPDFDTKSLEAKKMVLEELVRQELLVQEAQQTGVADKKEIVDAVSEFKRTLLVREVASKMIETISVTDEEAEDYFNKN